MNHPEYQDLIDLAAGVLEESQAKDVREHTATCDICTETVARFRLAQSLTRDLALESPPAAAVARAYALDRSHAPASHSMWVGARLLRKFRSRMPSTSRQPPQTAFARVLVGFVVAAVVFLGGTGVMVSAAQGALPGDALYPVKTANEAFQVAVSFSPIDKAELHLNFAQNRAAEIQALGRLGRFEQVPTAATAYQREINQTVELLVQASGRYPDQAAALFPQVEKGLARDTKILSDVSQMLPEDSKTDLDKAIMASNSSVSDVQSKVVPAAPTALPPLTTRTDTANPSPTGLDTATSPPKKTVTGSVSTEPPAAFKPTATPRSGDTPEASDTPLPADTSLPPGLTPEPGDTPPPQPTNASRTPVPQVTPVPDGTPGPLGTPVPQRTPGLNASPSPDVTPNLNGTPGTGDTPGPNGTPGQDQTPDPEQTPRPTHTPKPTHSID